MNTDPQRSITTFLPPAPGKNQASKFNIDQNPIRIITGFMKPYSNIDLKAKQPSTPTIINSSITTFLPPRLKVHREPNANKSSTVDVVSITVFKAPQVTTQFTKLPEESIPETVGSTLKTALSKLDTLKHLTPNVQIQPQVVLPKITPVLEVHNTDVPEALEEITPNSVEQVVEVKEVTIEAEQKNVVEPQLPKPPIFIPVIPKVEGKKQENHQELPAFGKEVQSTQGWKRVLVMLSMGVVLLIVFELVWLFVLETNSTPPKQPNKEKIQNPERATNTETTAVASIGTAIVKTRTGAPLVMRADTNKDSAKRLEIPNGEVVEVLAYASYFSVVNGENGKWVQVRYKGTEGWCWGLFLQEVQK